MWLRHGMRRFYASGGRALREAFPRHYDIVGDIAVFKHPVQECDLRAAADRFFAARPGVKVIALKTSGMAGAGRQSSHIVVAGENRLHTTHKEYGIQTQVHVSDVFFSQRMAAERHRISSRVEEGDRVLILFAGCGPLACMVAKRTSAAETVCIESNSAAFQCLLESRTLNKIDPLRMPCFLADVRDFPTLPTHVGAGLVHSAQRARLPTYTRLVIPRPKIEPEATYLDIVLQVADVRKGAMIHYYDFATQEEISTGAPRTLSLLESTCKAAGWKIVGTPSIFRASGAAIGIKLYRICVDFRVLPDNLE
ncbi:taw22 [Symbiodinium sp. KB8]|nr:taw22 [Symbiodinium sp. KB8]